LLVLVAGHAAHADGADHLAVDHQRHAARGGEYARQGVLVRTVRIAVNNLAGVPSIVFGVFGLGFFCYIFGGRIDSLFFPAKLPTPTFGTGGILWASLTLALLTLPVVIVATEEALAAVPGSMREGSYACGASRWTWPSNVRMRHSAPYIFFRSLTGGTAGLFTGVFQSSALGRPPTNLSGSVACPFRSLHELGV